MPVPPNNTCQHCGSPILDDTAHRGFCCQGCAHVHTVILENGLGKYYELRDTAIAPVKPAALEPRDFSWLNDAGTAAEQNATGGVAALNLGVQGISCVGCVWLIEKLYTRQAGAVRADINPQEGRLRLEWLPGKIALPAFARELQNVGYLLGTVGDKPASETSGLVLRIGLCGAFAMNGMLHILPTYLGMDDTDAPAPFFRLLSIFFATLALLVGGSYFINRAWRSLRAGVLHIDLPIALGVSAAYLGSFAGWFLRDPALEYWDFISLFIFLMLTGRWLQERAVERNRLRLLALNPRPAHVRYYPDENNTGAEDDNIAVNLPVESIEPGQVFGIAPGQVLPVCGALQNDTETLSLEWINGESVPRTFLAGALVPAGAVNISRRELRFTARETWPESLLARLIAAREEKPFRNRTLEHTLAAYLVTVLVIAGLGLLGWGLGTGNWAAALQVMISVLIVSCPCTIGLAFPLATELAVARLRALGVHVRDNSLWERLRRVRIVVFDKTGTLTLETPTLQNPEALEKLAAPERRALFQLVESSLHPVSRGLREALLTFPESRTNDTGAAGTIEETTAAGLTLHDPAGKIWRLGKPGWDELSTAQAFTAADLNSALGTTRSTQDKNDAAADSVFTRDGVVLAQFQLRETVRPGAVRAVAALEKRYLPVYLLSGDRTEKVSSMLDKLRLPAERGLANLSPEQKADWIARHAEGRALMIGDGANDALAFSRAICRGTPVVDKGLLEKQADFYLMGHSLDGILRLLDTAAHRQRVLFGVFTFAVLYNTFTVGVCLAGKMTPLLAALLMPTSALVVLGVVSLAFREKRRR